MSCQSCWQHAMCTVYCPGKYELRRSHFALISEINLLLWYNGGIQGIFLPFSIVFRRDQYFYFHIINISIQ